MKFHRCVDNATIAVVSVLNVSSVPLMILSLNRWLRVLYDHNMGSPEYSTVFIPSLVNAFLFWVIFLVTAACVGRRNFLAPCFSIFLQDPYHGLRLLAVAAIGAFNGLAGIFYTYPLARIPISAQNVLGFSLMIPSFFIARRIVALAHHKPKLTDDKQEKETKPLSIQISSPSESYDREHKVACRSRCQTVWHWLLSPINLYPLLAVIFVAVGVVLTLAPLHFVVIIGPRAMPVFWFLLSSCCMITYNLLTGWVLQSVRAYPPVVSVKPVQGERFFDRVAREEQHQATHATSSLHPLQARLTVLVGNTTFQLAFMVLYALLDREHVLGHSPSFSATFHGVADNLRRLCYSSPVELSTESAFQGSGLLPCVLYIFGLWLNLVTIAYLSYRSVPFITLLGLVCGPLTNLVHSVARAWFGFSSAKGHAAVEGRDYGLHLGCMVGALVCFSMCALLYFLWERTVENKNKEKQEKRTESPSKEVRESAV